MIHTMSPDPLFWYGLVLKMAMTATIVVVASVAVERSGPFIGALIAALPTAAGAAYIILALEHPPAFIAASAVGSAAANAAVAIFALTYAVLAQRHGIVLSIAVATLVWFAAAAACSLSRGRRRVRSASMCSSSASPFRPPRATVAPRCRGKPSSGRATISHCARRPPRWWSRR
jgi:uncharacterized membrane protein (GlpM family)